MDPTRRMPLHATITHRADTGAVDAHNVPTLVETVTATRCWVELSGARSRSNETTVGMNVGDENWLGYFPPGTAIDHTDSITVPPYGTFEVSAPPWTPAISPFTGRATHVEVSLRRTV